MINSTFDNKTKPFITPESFYGKHEKICDVCVITFSYKVIEWAQSHLQCKKVKEIRCCNGNHPIYLTEWKGKKIAFYMTVVSAAGAGTCLEEARCLVGCTHYVVFGTCGTLNSRLTDGKLIVPTHAYRDEGLSYHYIEADDYIALECWEQTAKFMAENNLPYITGRTWSTDGLYRETTGKAEQLRREGCIAVEMECAGMQAVCSYHHLHLYNFLFASDCLEIGEWHNEILGKKEEWDSQVKYFMLALDLAASLETD
ncbi:MAG: nucleoside phosphorylase [Clostridia bacterium]|nr:nucleoside phosphorylase [Clostridia bacterium]